MLEAAFGPVFGRELLERARQPRTYVVRVLLAIVLLGVFLSVYYLLVVPDPNLPNEPGIRATNRAAGYVVAALLWVQLHAAWLLTPALLCGALAGERERGTLDLLFATHLRSRDIVAGKLGARLAEALQLLLAPLPAVVIMATLGGVDVEGALKMQIAPLGAALVSAGLSIYFSARSRTPLRAALATWATGLALFVILPQAAYFSTWFFAWPPETYAAHALFNPHVYAEGIASATSAWSNFGPFLPFAPLGFAAVFLLGASLASWRLRTPLALPRQRRGRARWRRVPERFLGLEVANALWLRARQAPVHDRERGMAWFRRAVAAFAALLVARAVWEASLAPWRFAHASAGTTLLLWCLIAWPMTLAAAFGAAGDRSRGFLDHALVTAIPRRSYLAGYFLAAMEHARSLWLWAYLVPGGAVVCLLVTAQGGFLEPHGWRFRETAAACGMHFLLMATVMFVGVAFSLTARSAAGAFGGTVAFAIVACGWGDALLAVLHFSLPNLAFPLPLAIFVGAVLVMAATWRWRPFPLAVACAIAAAVAAQMLWRLDGGDAGSNFKFAPLRFAVQSLYQAAEPARGNEWFGRCDFVVGLKLAGSLALTAALVAWPLLSNFDRLVRRPRDPEPRRNP